MGPNYGVDWWNSLGTWVTAFSTLALFFATIAQVYVTKIVGNEVRKASQISEKQANSRYVNEQWQRLNLNVIMNEKISDTANKVYEAGRDVNQIAKRGLIFYILNILYDMYNVQGEYIDDAFRNQMTYDHVEIMLGTSKSDLKDILENNRGYTSEFRDYISMYIANIDKRVRTPISADTNRPKSSIYIYGDTQGSHPASTLAGPDRAVN